MFSPQLVPNSPWEALPGYPLSFTILTLWWTENPGLDEGREGGDFSWAASVSLCQLLGYSEKPLTLQMFIGTADERNLRPHAFYQVHRITGKMVATASYEAVVSGTKVLEMTLLPENNMAAK